MSLYTLRRGNAPLEFQVNGGTITNNGPGTVFYGDSQDVTALAFEGSLAPAATVTVDGTQWLVTNGDSAVVNVTPVALGFTQGPAGATGAKGDTGDDGAVGATDLLLPFSQPGTLAAGFGIARAPVAFNAVINSIVVTAGTAPTGSDIVVDVKRWSDGAAQGVSLFQDDPSSAPRVAAGANSSDAVVPPSTGLASGDTLTVDITDVGSDIPGASLTAMIYLTKTAVQPPPIVGYTIRDTFTDTDQTLLAAHTGETGAGWSRHPVFSGGLKITDANRVQVTNANQTALFLASGVPSTAEYDIGGTLFFRSIETTMRVGVVARQDPTVNTGYLFRWETDGSRWVLYQFVSNVSTELGNFAATYTGNSTVLFRAEIRNATKKLFVKAPGDPDYVQRISSADNTITAAGLVGIRMLNNSNLSNQGIHFDDITVTAA